MAEVPTITEKENLTVNEQGEVTRRDLPEGHEANDFYNEHDGLHGRAPGIYLDRLERENAEKARSLVENRSPDFSNLPSTAGTPVVVRDRLRETAQSEARRINDDPEYMGSLPVDVRDPAAVAEKDTGYADLVRGEAQQRNTLNTESGLYPSQSGIPGTGTPVGESTDKTIVGSETNTANTTTETPQAYSVQGNDNISKILNDQQYK